MLALLQVGRIFNVASTKAGCTWRFLDVT